MLLNFSLNALPLYNTQEDGWDTDPFVLTEIDGKMFGRGSTDDKVLLF